MSEMLPCRHLSHSTSRSHRARRLCILLCMIRMSVMQNSPGLYTRPIQYPSAPLGCHDLFLFWVRYLSVLLSIEHDTPYVRETTARALATALPRQLELFEAYLQKLVDLYQEKVSLYLTY